MSRSKSQPVTTKQCQRPSNHSTTASWPERTTALKFLPRRSSSVHPYAKVLPSMMSFLWKSKTKARNLEMCRSCWKCLARRASPVSFRCCANSTARPQESRCSFPRIGTTLSSPTTYAPTRSFPPRPAKPRISCESCMASTDPCPVPAIANSRWSVGAMPPTDAGISSPSAPPARRSASTPNSPQATEPSPMFALSSLDKARMAKNGSGPMPDGVAIGSRSMVPRGQNSCSPA